MSGLRLMNWLTKETLPPYFCLATVFFLVECFLRATQSSDRAWKQIIPAHETCFAHLEPVSKWLAVQSEDTDPDKTVGRVLATRTNQLRPAGETPRN